MAKVKLGDPRLGERGVAQAYAFGKKRQEGGRSYDHSVLSVARGVKELNLVRSTDKAKLWPWFGSRQA